MERMSATAMTTIREPLRVLVTDPLHRYGRDRLDRFTQLTVVERPTRSEFLALVSNADVLICRSSVVVDAEALDCAPHLRAVIRAGNGLDNIDAAHAGLLGVTVSSIPSPGVNAVAEFVLASLLTLSRRIVEADRQVREGIWAKSALCGTELGGRTLGLVGCGRIGTRVAELAQGFNMQVCASVEHPSADREVTMRAKGIDLLTLEELVEKSDAISIQVPGGPATHGLVDAQVLTHVKPGCLLIDVSRSGVVDHQAVLDGLRSGHIAGAAADVHAQESGIPLLAQHPSGVVTPHIGGSTEEAQLRIAAEVVRRVQALDQTGRASHGV
ncbi:3-phosphoglycerate dehydrogenase [Micrococcus sp. FDAARGOS_333]|nr:3-phosphoglycerate dehydrogenase [Micrococcus sp. FDAARGOS_333]